MAPQQEGGGVIAKPLKILGISGSPHRGNTELMLSEALSAAKKVGGISTEAVLLRRKTINYCIGCFRCHRTSENESICKVHTDSMEAISRRLLACDGLILASPVYFAGVTAQLKTLMDRTEPLLRYSLGPLKSSLRNKVGAGIAVGGNRNGGQEATLQAINHFFLIHDMIVVGTGPDECPGCYLGAAGFSGMDPELDKKVLNAVSNDEIGMRAARVIGRRMAEAVKLVSRDPGTGRSPGPRRTSGGSPLQATSSL